MLSLCGHRVCGVENLLADVRVLMAESNPATIYHATIGIRNIDPMHWELCPKATERSFHSESILSQGLASQEHSVGKLCDNPLE